MSLENSFWSLRCQWSGKLQERTRTREKSFIKHDPRAFKSAKTTADLELHKVFCTQDDVNASPRCLTVLRGRAGRQAAALDLLPPQPDSLFELLNLRVAVALLLLTLLRLSPHVVLHQLNGGNE